MQVFKKQFLILCILSGLFLISTFQSRAEEDIITLNQKVVKQLSLSECLNMAMSSSPDVISSTEDIELSKVLLENLWVIFKTPESC